MRFAAVAIRGEPRRRARARRARRGWRLPVGYDHDGAVANAYAVAVCPTITFAHRGGARRGHRRSAAQTPAALEALCATLRSCGERRAAVLAGWVDADARRRAARAARSPGALRAAPPRGPSPPALRDRLRVLSDRSAAPQAIALRGRAIPHAYRVLFRHVGLEPDVTRIPVEALVVERLRRGGFPSRGLLPDALPIACVETGVPVWALDADRLTGRRACGPRGRRRARAVGPARARRRSRALAVLFEAPEEPTRATRRLALFSVVVPGVPALFAEEALWTAGEALEA